MVDLVSDVETASVDSLTPYVNNPKDHPDEQVEKIANSIKEFGFTVPMVVDGDGVIVAGHGRYQAVKEHLELDHVPVITRDDLSDAQIDAFRVADNRITESTWDIELLGEELEQLQHEEIDLDVTGFNDDELESFGAEVGDAPDPREEFEESMGVEYENEDETATFSFQINFRNKDDLQEFAQLVDATVTEDTTSIWFPKQERRDVENTGWADES